MYYPAHPTRIWCGDRMLHLHRAQHSHRLPLTHRVTFSHVYLDDRACHRRYELLHSAARLARVGRMLDVERPGLGERVALPIEADQDIEIAPCHIYPCAPATGIEHDQ